MFWSRRVMAVQMIGLLDVFLSNATIITLPPCGFMKENHWWAKRDVLGMSNPFETTEIVLGFWAGRVVWFWCPSCTRKHFEENSTSEILLASPLNRKMRLAFARQQWSKKHSRISKPSHWSTYFSFARHLELCKVSLPIGSARLRFLRDPLRP